MTTHRIRDDDSKDAIEIEGVRCIREADTAIYCVGASGLEDDRRDDIRESVRFLRRIQRHVRPPQR